MIEERSRNASSYSHPKINHLSMGELKEKTLSKKLTGSRKRKTLEWNKEPIEYLWVELDLMF